MLSIELEWLLSVPDKLIHPLKSLQDYNNGLQKQHLPQPSQQRQKPFNHLPPQPQQPPQPCQQQVIGDVAEVTSELVAQVMEGLLSGA